MGRFKVCNVPGTFLHIPEFAQEDQAESWKAKPAGSISESSGFSCSFFFSPPSRKTSVCSIAYSKMERIDRIIHDSVKVSYRIQKD